MNKHIKIGLIVVGVPISLVVLFFLFLIVALLIARGIGPGMSDWSLKLPNNYEMWHINPQNIMIGYKDSQYTIKTVDNKGRNIGIPGDVIEFCYNDRYVGAKQVNIPTNPKKGVDTSNPRYYLLDTLEQKVYGPFLNVSQFDDAADRS